jgi:hypothetical protein
LSKLVVIIDDRRLYLPDVNIIKGMLIYLKNNKYLVNPNNGSQIDAVEFITAYQVKVYSKYKKIEVIGNIEDNNQIISIDDENTFYLILSDRIKSKSVPNNIAVVCSSIRINQEDGKGGIYKLLPANHTSLTLSNMYDILSNLKLLKKQHVKLKDFINTKNITSGGIIYYTAGKFLLLNIAKCSMIATDYYLTQCFDRLLNIGYEKFCGLASTVFTRLNEVIRDKKMSKENMLNYEGFEFLTEVIEKFSNSQEKLNGKEHYWNYDACYLEKFINSLLTVMIAHELKYYIVIDGYKLLHLHNDVDILFNNPEYILPHMESYIGYLITTRHTYGEKHLTLFKEFKNKNILDYIHDCKELKSNDSIGILCIKNNDDYVKRYFNLKS